MVTLLFTVIAILIKTGYFLAAATRGSVQY